MNIENFLGNTVDINVVDRYLSILAKRHSQYERTTLNLNNRILSYEKTNQNLFNKIEQQEKHIKNIQIELLQSNKSIISELNQLKQQSKLVGKTIGKWILIPDGTAIDSETGLMWCRYLLGEKCEKNKFFGIPKKMNFSAAKEIVNDFNSYNFFNDWRIPKFNELKSIQDIDKTIFPNTPNYWFLSSTKKRDGSYSIVQFGNVKYKYDDAYVRLVRG
jgi:hypothetical protein